MWRHLLAATIVDIVRYFLVIVIFYCANTTAFLMSDWKFWKGVYGLN